MKEARDFTIEYMPVPAQRECLHEMYEATDKCDFVKEARREVIDGYSRQAHTKFRDELGRKHLKFRPKRKEF